MVVAGSSGGRGRLGRSRGSRSWRLCSGGGAWLSMDVLLGELCQRPYHGQEPGDGVRGQSAGGGWRAAATKVGDGEWNRSIPFRMELNDADTAQVSIRGDSKEGEAEAVERMGWIDDLDRLSRQRGPIYRGS